MKSFIGAVIFICVALSANAQLLWKVSGNGLSSPSYIMGTHHLAPLSVKDGITGLQKAMDETQQVYGELKMSDIQSPATIQKMQKMMMIESDTTLTTLLSPEDYETANKFCKENLMMDLNMAPKIKPAFLLNNIAVVAYIKHIGNYNPQEQLDTYFQTQATQKGKKVDGLETPDFQFNLLYNGISLQRQAQLLMCTLNNIDKEVESLKRLTDAYMKQDLETMLKINEERKGNQCDALPTEEDALIYDRNKTWAQKLPAIMKAAPTFVAVGALHLPGNKGLLSLLKKQGYTVEIMNYKTYLFDFDYTLADSSRGIVTCFRNVLNRHQYTNVTDEAIKRTIGKTLEESFSILTGVTDWEQLTAFRQEYRLEADVHMNVNTRLFPDTLSTLKELKERGARIGIISTKYRFRILSFLDEYLPENFLDIVVGGEDVQAAKPSPEGIKFALEHLGRTPQETLYIGDSTVDAETAQNAGVDFAGVLNGMTTADELRAYPHRFIMENLSGLLYI